MKKIIWIILWLFLSMSVWTNVWSQQLPNLTPYQPPGWSDKIVVTNKTGCRSSSCTDSSSLLPTDKLYVDWAVINNGSASTSARFYTQLYVDGTPINQWYTDPPLDANYYINVNDYSIGSLSAGTHTIKIMADSTNAISESNENDNAYTKTITVQALQYTLQVIESPSGSGSVSISPNKSTYSSGEQVTLTATANPGYTFSNWGGGVASGTANPITITMNADTAVIAYFTQNINPSGPPKISVSPIALNFGNLNVASTLQETITILNNGSSDLIISSTSNSGTNPSDFNNSNNCTTISVNNSCTLTVTFAPTSPGRKSATLWITSNDPKKPTVKVRLSGNAVCTYSVSSSSQQCDASGGTWSVNVTTPSGCNWTAISKTPWITITSGSSGNGTETVNYGVAANTGTRQRTGRMTIAKQTFTVTQSATSSFSISLPKTSALPLTPLYISTIGLMQGASVNVTFSDSKGYSVKGNALRVDPDGTVLVGIPLYVDPKTQKIMAGTVNIVASQTLSNGSQGQQSPPVSFTIEDLPSITGIPLGQITHSFLTASALIAQGRIFELEFLETSLNGKVDTSAARDSETKLLQSIILSRNDIDVIINDPTHVINVGSAADGTPLQFTQNSLGVMDRVIVIWLSGLPLNTTSSGNLSKVHVASIDSDATQIDINTVNEYLKQLSTWIGLKTDVNTLQNTSSTTRDNVLALTDGGVGSASLLGAKTEGVGLFTGIAGVQNAVYHYLTDFFNVLNDVISCSSSTTVPCNITVADTDALTKNGAASLVSAYTKAGISNLDYLYKGALTGPAALAVSMYNLVAGNSNAQVNQEIDAVIPSARNGGAWITGPVQETRTQSGLDMILVSALPFTNDSIPMTGLTDANGNYILPVPTDRSGNIPSALTIHAFDPITGQEGGSEDVDLNGANRGQTITPPPINYVSPAPPGSPIKFDLPNPIPKKACQNVPYSYQVPIPTGGAGPPYHFQLGTMGGFPPMGIILDPSGVLSGTTTSPPNTYNFTICAVDLGGNQSCQPTSIKVNASGCGEVYKGTGTITGTSTCAYPAGDSTCVPQPYIGTSTYTFAVEIDVDNSLLVSGNFSGTITIGQITGTEQSPAYTCFNPDGSIRETSPAKTNTFTTPGGSGPITGTSDGRTINFDNFGADPSCTYQNTGTLTVDPATGIVKLNFIQNSKCNDTATDCVDIGTTQFLLTRQ